MSRFLVALSALLLVGTLGSASAEQRVSLKQLPPEVRTHVLKQLRAMGVEPNEQMSLGITTDDCPSDCNDSVGGGKCFCDATDGKCPGTSEPVPTEPGRCRADPKTGSVTGGGLSEPAQVMMP